MEAVPTDGPPAPICGGRTLADAVGICFVFQAYRDTLQTQWSWLLQITKCIDVHLKENAAYNQVICGQSHPSLFPKVARETV